MFLIYRVLASGSLNAAATSVFARVQIKNGNVLLLHSSLFISSFNCLYERDQKVLIQPKLSRFSGDKRN